MKQVFEESKPFVVILAFIFGVSTAVIVSMLSFIIFMLKM